MRRELWETLVDVMESVAASEAAELGLQIHSVSLDLPIELRAHPTDVGFRLLADLPRWRWAGGFEEVPGRLQIHLRLEPALTEPERSATNHQQQLISNEP